MATSKKVTKRKVKRGLFSQPNLQQVVEKLTEIPLPLSLSYKILEVSSIVNDLYVAYDKKRLEIVTKHCKKDEKGELVLTEDKNNYQIENLEAFNKEFADMLDEEIEIEVVNLKNFQNANLSAKDMHMLLSTIAQY